MALTIKKQYLNPYERAYNAMSTHKLFNKTDWEDAAKKGSLDQYVMALDNTKNLDVTKFYKDYNLDYSTPDTRRLALYNEAFADKEVKNRAIDKYDDSGNIIGTEDVQISDYEYNKLVINEQTAAAKQEYFTQLINDYKSSQNFLVKTAGYTGSLVTSGARGLLAGINDITEFLGGIIEGTAKSIANDSSWAESVGEVMSTDKYRPFQFIEDATINFEKQYGYRDPMTGNYNTFGAIVGGALESLGKMAPSAALAYATGGGSALAQSLISMGTFYTASEFAQGYEQKYISAKQLAISSNDFEPNYLEIMGMEAISTTAKVAVSVGLGKLMGGTYVKNKAFGLKNTAKGISEGTSTLAKYFMTLGGDALEEGIEEVLQDSVEALVFNSMYGGDYAQLSQLNASDLAITFLSAALGGLIGTGAGIIATRKIDIDVDGKSTQLNKIDSFLLNSDFGNIIKDFSDMKSLANKIENSRSADRASKMYDNLKTTGNRAYKAFRVISSMFGEIGETRAKNVLQALNRISKAAEAGLFNADTVSTILDSVVEQISTLQTAYKINNAKKLKDELEQAGITELAQNISTGEDTIEISQEIRDKIEDIHTKSKAKNTIVVAKNGKDIVVADDNSTVIVPKDNLNSETTEQIIKHIAAKKCKNVVNNLPSFKQALALLRNVFAKTYDKQRNDNAILSAFFSNGDFVTECLFADSSLTISFINEISELLENISKVSTDTVEAQFAKHFIKTAQSKWKVAIKEYLQIKPDATVATNILTASEQKAINIDNPIRLLYSAFDGSRFDVSKLSTDEYNLLSNILMKAKTVDKTLTTSVLRLENIVSYRQITSIIAAYTKAQTVEENYLRNDTAPNRMFNKWLKYSNLTLSTMLDESLLTQNDRDIMTTLNKNIYEYRKYQFENNTNGIYTVNIVNHNITINNRTRYSIEAIYSKADEDVQALSKDIIRKSYRLSKDKKTMLATDNKVDIIRSLLNSDIVNPEQYTIDDILTKPELLNEDTKSLLIKNNIIQTTELGTIVDERKFVKFLRSEIVKSTNGELSIIQLQTGKYVFAQTVHYKDIVDLQKLEAFVKQLDVDKLRNGDVLELLSCIDNRFDDTDVTFKYTNSTDASGRYDKHTHTIYISDYDLKMAKTNILVLFDTIAHEYLHMLQLFTNQSMGFSGSFVTSQMITFKNGKYALVWQFREKYNELLTIFEAYIPSIKTLPLQQQAKLMDDVLYSMCSGELISFGISDADYDATFIPFIMTDEGILFSNGKRFTYKQTSESIFELKTLLIPSEEKTTIPTLLDLIDDPDYQNTMELYNYLSKVSDFGSPNDMYIDKYIYENKEWQASFETALNDFANTKSAQAIAAYVQLGTLGSIDLNTNNELTQNVLATLTPDDRVKSLKLAHIQLAPQMSFEEFLNTDFPFIRIQHVAETYDTDAMSISIGSFATASFAKSMYEAFKKDIDNYIIVGKIKPSDLICYLEPSHFEAFVKPSNIVGSARFKVDLSEDGVIVYDNETQQVTITGSEDLSYGQLLSKEEKAIGQDSEEVDEKAYTKKYKPKYTKRKAIQNKQTSEVKFEYEYPKRGNRQISKKLAGDTNLQYYVGAQMSPEMQQFVVNATQLNAPDYIDDIRKGKLTRSKLLKDFTFGLITNERTFKLINDSFYKNTDVHSLSELNNLIENSRDAWITAILLKAANMGTDILNLGPDTLIQLREVLFKDEKLVKLYTRLEKSYETSYAHFGHIEIDNNYLRVLIMKNYDGTIESLRKCVTIARTVASYNHSGVDVNATGVSTEQSIKGGRKGETVGAIGDTLSSSVAQDLDDIVDASRNEKVSALLRNALHQIQDLSTKKDFDAEKMLAKYHAYETKLKDATDAQIDKAYFKLIQNELHAKQETVEVSEVEQNDLSEIVKRSIKKDKANIVRGISHQINTIERNLSFKEKQLFLKDNADIFNDDLTLKDEVLYDKDAYGANIYKDIEILQALKSRIHQLSIDVRSGAYESKKSVDYRKQLAKEIARYKDALSKQLSKPSKNTAVTIVEQDRSLTINIDRSIPPKLQELLAYGLTKQADSNIQYLSEKNEKHTVVSLKNFIDDNIEILSKLTQEEVLDIVDFYLTSIPAFISDSARYSSLQVIILSYLYKSALDGVYKLDNTRLEQVHTRLKNIVNEAGTTFNTWQTAMKMFNAAELIVSAMYKRYNVNIEPEQLTKLGKAFKTNDPVEFAKVRKEIYDELRKTNSRKYLKDQQKREKEALRKATGDDTNAVKASVSTSINSFFTKVWNIERMFMLSGPGTWIRNIVSNTLIGGVYVKDKQILPGLNTVSGKVGSFIQKLLPQKWKKESQYQLAGVKVSSDTAAFIKTHYLDTGLINMIGDSVTKYDARKISKNKSTADIYSELITDKLAQDVFYDNHKVAKIFTKLLSDDKYVNRTAIVYFGKILTEAKIDLSQGITNDVTAAFVDAYVLAANDYMHKTNFMHKIDNVVRDRFGETGYFVWKQFFPFAASAVNWYTEALRYTPIGLVKSIVNYANLEKKIAKMEDLRSKGERIPSSKFAQYIEVRNIGKGVIGTIGVLIGGALALSGAVHLDDEDDKYKLKAGDVSVDITELFGTQGILLGMSVFQGIKDTEKFDTIMKHTFNTIAEDSLYTSVLNMFRYGGDNAYDNLKSYLTYNIPSMFIPSFLKTITSIAKRYDVAYSKGILGKLEKLAVNSIPFLDRTMTKKIDIYTGESQIAYNSWFLDVLLSKLGTVKFSTAKMSYLEELAIVMNINHSQLTGNYTVNDESITLTAEEIEQLNIFYAKLNSENLTAFINNKSKHKVKQEDGTYKELTYAKMTDKEKATVFDNIMSSNSSKSKIYILTSSNKYKYYASESMYEELRKLGITKNVYKATNKLSGFIPLKSN